MSTSDHSSLRVAIWIAFAVAAYFVLSGPVWGYLRATGMDASRAMLVAAAAGIGMFWSLKWILDAVLGKPDADGGG